MTLSDSANLSLNEQQRAVVGALTNGSCYLKRESDGNYQLYHEEQAIGYKLSAAEVESMLNVGLVSKTEMIKLTLEGRTWAIQTVTL